MNIDEVKKSLLGEFKSRGNTFRRVIQDGEVYVHADFLNFITEKIADTINRLDFCLTMDRTTEQILNAANKGI
jgi:hypothetical protein